MTVDTKAPTRQLLHEAYRLSAEIAEARRSPHGEARVIALGATRHVIEDEIVRRAKKAGRD